MRVQFNQVTWYSRLLTFLFVFGVFPVIVFVIGKRYQETVMVLSYAESSAYALHATGTYEATAYAGKGSLKAERQIVGDWVSDTDAKYKIKIKSINTFYDLYRDKIIASGSWLFRDRLPEEVQDKFVDAVGSIPGLFFQKNILDNTNKESVQYYKVVSLDKDKLVLYFLDSGKTVSFSRAAAPVSEDLGTTTSTSTPISEEEVTSGLLR